MDNSNIIIYQTEDGKTKIQTRLENETVWLTIEQMVELFQKSRSTINEHILNIFDENELIKKPALEKSEFPIFLPSRRIITTLMSSFRLVTG